MKRYLLFLCGVFSLLTCYSQEGFTLKIKLSNFKNYTPFIFYTNDNKHVLDTTHTTENGWLIFKGKVSEPVIVSFGTRRNPNDVIRRAGGGFIPGPPLLFFLTNEEIKIEGDADAVYMAKVEGGTANKEWSSIRPKQNELVHESWTALKKAYESPQSGDAITLSEAEKLGAENEKKEAKLKRDFMKKNPNSLVSLYFLSGMQISLSPQELKAEYGKLGNTYKNGSIAKGIAKQIESMEATAIGKEAIALHKNDVNGKEVSLETLKGKYVLLDFWGSWCMPCRATHPHLKELYAKYKADGFEILGIAQELREKLEDSRKTWIAAINQDEIPWLQVLNDEGKEQFDAVKAYGVTSYPTKILLDREGKIIARYAGEEGDIDKKLKEIFGK